MDDARTLDYYSNEELSEILLRATLYDIALAWHGINKQLLNILGEPPP